VVSDIDEARVARVGNEFSAGAVGLDDILFQDVDVIAPCALGAILNTTSIPRIRASIVAGGANNQLETPEDGQRLADAGVLYAPDYVINGGGIINVACEYYGNVDDAGVMDLVAEIGPRLTRVFAEADRSGQPTNEVADAQARQIIADAVR
jgi:leucine dehydrogenase